MTELGLYRHVLFCWLIIGYSLFIDLTNISLLLGIVVLGSGDIMVKKVDKILLSEFILCWEQNKTTPLPKDNGPQFPENVYTENS